MQLLEGEILPWRVMAVFQQIAELLVVFLAHLVFQGDGSRQLQQGLADYFFAEI